MILELFYFQKKAGHNRGPPQQKQPIEDQDCSWTTTLKNCLSAVV